MSHIQKIQKLQNILVAGGAGFIGCNFVRSTLRDRPQVRVVNLDALTYAGSLSNLSDVEPVGATGDGTRSVPATLERYTFIKGDISDRELVRRIFDDHRIDTVVNFAAESHVDRSITGPAAFIQTNIVGTFTLLEAAREAWAGRTADCRFLHVSTDEVYGTLGPDDPPFAETTAYAPNSPYSASKAASDHLVRAYHHTYGLPTLTTNCSNNYGPFQYPEKLIPLMILNALTGKPLPVYGDGLQVRDWLYVEDHCASGRDCFGAGLRRRDVQHRRRERVAEHRDRPPGMRGVGPPSAQARRRQLCPADHARQGPARPRPPLCHRRPKDPRRARLAPRESFETGIRKTIAWYLDHQDWVNGVMSEKYGEWIALNYAERGSD